MGQDLALEAALASLAENDREAVRVLRRLEKLLRSPPKVPRRVRCQVKIGGARYRATLTEPQAEIVRRTAKEHPQAPHRVTQQVRRLLSSVQVPAAAALVALEQGLRGEKKDCCVEIFNQPPPVGACVFEDGSCQQLTEVTCHQQPGWVSWTQGPCPPPGGGGA
jgi:hypothetical protein